MNAISFGTSGWRDLLGEGFTFGNVRAVTQAIADYLRDSGAGAGPVIVAHDTRFLAEEFSNAVSEVLAGNDMRVIQATGPIPTPTVAWEILARRAAGAINITASHNPHQWNGLKFSPANAGPALPEMTAAIEKRANILLREPDQIRRATGDQKLHAIHREPVGAAYLEQLERIVDMATLRAAHPKIAVDPLYGTGVGFLDTLLRKAGAEVVALHTQRDPYFGGGRPEPEGESLRPLVETVKREGAVLGLATDCDADRFGIVDRDGTFFTANQVLSLLVGYLAETRKWTGRVGRSVATTHLFDAAARARGLETVETPVGFKYLGNLLIEGKIVLAGEESGGLAMSGHVPDKDGVLACLLVAEMVARRGKSLRAQLDDLFAEVGPCYTARRDLTWSAGPVALNERLDGIQKKLAGRKIARVVTIDGKKFVLEDGSWVLARASGTEPIIRLYGEASNEAALGEVLDAFAAALGIDASQTAH